MVTFKQVNKALADRGYKAELVKGEGYFYFVGETCYEWLQNTDGEYSTTVYVYRLNDLSLAEWLEQFEGFNKKFQPVA